MCNDLTMEMEDSFFSLPWDIAHKDVLKFHKNAVKPPVCSKTNCKTKLLASTTYWISNQHKTVVLFGESAEL